MQRETKSAGSLSGPILKNDLDDKYGPSEDDSRHDDQWVETRIQSGESKLQ